MSEREPAYYNLQEVNNGYKLSNAHGDWVYQTAEALLADLPTRLGAEAKTHGLSLSVDPKDEYWLTYVLQPSGSHRLSVFTDKKDAVDFGNTEPFQVRKVI